MYAMGLNTPKEGTHVLRIMPIDKQQSFVPICVYMGLFIKIFGPKGVKT